MIYLKIHATEQGKMLAMCDESIIDKVLSDSKVEINIRDYSDFYKGKLYSEEQAEKVLEEQGIVSVNIVGEISIKLAVAAKLVDHHNIREVNAVPYAQAYRIDY